MTSLSTLLQAIEVGDHADCQGCPWNPRGSGPKPAFATSCCRHGADYGLPGGALSVQVSENPGGSGAEKTKRLCFVCNVDATATNALQLWEAAISCKPYSEGDEYLRGHYWTNATMHGFKKEKDSLDRKMEKSVRSKCSAVLDKKRQQEEESSNAG